MIRKTQKTLLFHLLDDCTSCQRTEFERLKVTYGINIALRYLSICYKTKGVDIKDDIQPLMMSSHETIINNKIEKTAISGLFIPRDCGSLYIDHMKTILKVMKPNSTFTFQELLEASREVYTDIRKKRLDLSEVSRRRKVVPKKISATLNLLYACGWLNIDTFGKDWQYTRSTNEEKLIPDERSLIIYKIGERSQSLCRLTEIFYKKGDEISGYSLKIFKPASGTDNLCINAPVRDCCVTYPEYNDQVKRFFINEVKKIDI